MTTGSPLRRRHSEAFKRDVCTRIRAGEIGRREAQRLYALSDNLLHRWLRSFDDERPDREPVPADVHATCARRIELLERKVGQLTMALEEHRGDGRPGPATQARKPFSQAKKSSSRG